MEFAEEKDQKKRLLTEKYRTSELNASFDDESSAEKSKKSLVPAIKSFKTTRWRWVALLLISFMSFGNYFCYDCPNVVSEQIKHQITHEGEDSDGMRYNQLYAVVSYPNFILPLVGGILADKFGIAIIKIKI